jgi:lipid A 3-O-deacylase
MDVQGEHLVSQGGESILLRREDGKFVSKVCWSPLIRGGSPSDSYLGILSGLEHLSKVFPDFGDSVNKKLVLAVVLFLMGRSDLHAQAGPYAGGHELQVWAGGGHGTNGSQSGDGIFNFGARYGWILTDAHGPGLLRGRFEYAVDVVPVFVVAQKTDTAYGFGVDPFALKWMFDTRRGTVPYLELGGGTLFTNVRVPPGTSHVNFTPTGAAGLHFLRRRYNWSAEVRFMHISNAGLSRPNPGINTIQVRVGIGLFTQSQ